MAAEDPFGKATITTRVCPKCTSGEMSFGVLVDDNEFPNDKEWCCTAECPNCKFRWYVCRECNFIRSILDTKLKRYNHGWRYHNENKSHPGKKKGHNETTISTKRKTGKSSGSNPRVNNDPDFKEDIQDDDNLASLSNDNFATLYNDCSPSVSSIPSENTLGIGLKEPPTKKVKNTIPPVTVITDIPQTPTQEHGGVPGAVAKCKFMRSASIHYFSHNYHDPNGLAYLVSSSFYNTHILPQNISRDDLNMCLKICLLVKTLTINQCNQIGEFLNLLLTRLDIAYNQDTRSSISIPPIPRNPFEIRTKIRDGKLAFLNILPHPNIYRMNDGHVYVLPSECIRHLLAFGHTPLQFNGTEVQYPVQNMNQTKRGIAINQQLSKITPIYDDGHPHFNISFLEWKDDCEPAKSNNISKHGLWLSTITIFLKKSGRDTPIGTFPIAIGPKSNNHDALEKIIGNDIKKMRTKKIDAFLGKSELGPSQPCSFSADLYMSLGDQPERRLGNFLSAGNGSTHARWRHCCDYGQLVDVMPACPTCFQEMLDCDSYTARKDPTIDKRQWRNRVCLVCSNWGKDLNHPLLEFHRSKDFPKNYGLGGEQYDGPLRPIILTYEILEKVIRVTFDKVSCGEWTKTQAVEYMTINCFHTDTAKEAVSSAVRLLQYNRAKESAEDDPDRFSILSNYRSKHPEKYLPMSIPSIYQRGLPLTLFADTPMHLLLLGVGRTVFKKISTWSSRRGRKGVFVKLARTLLKQLDNLKLSWLLYVPHSFCEKWGGWVSKHYASLMRVALWIYSPLMSIDDGPIYEDPVIDAAKWTRDQYHDWLKARGLDTKGNKPQLQPRVMNYLLGPPENVPPIVPNLYGSAEDMLEMVKSMVILITTLFQEKMERGSTEIIDLRIRIFLTRYDRFEAPMRGPENKPSWLLSYNFLCLLNLPECIAEFGPIRKWFEGKWLGERYVTALKNERTKCGPKNVYYTLMRNLHQSKAISLIMGSETTSNQDYVDKDDQVHSQINGNTKIYSNMDDIESQYTMRHPLPVVLLHDGLIGCLYYRDGSNIGKNISVQVLEKTSMQEDQSLHHGLRYAKYKLTNVYMLFRQVQVMDFGVLLPKIGSDEPGVYTIITKNWSTEMFGEYNFHEEANFNSNAATATMPVHNSQQEDDSIIGGEWI